MITVGVRLMHENRHAHTLSFGPGKPPHPCGHGSAPGPVEASVLSVDAGSRGAPDRGSVRHPAVGLDGGALSGAVGVYPAEAGASLPLSGTRSGCAGGWTRSTRRSGRWQSGRGPGFTGEASWGGGPAVR